jgi:hypothetical protein
MNVFEREEFSSEVALKALSVLEAVALAVSDRSLLTESIKAAEVAVAERQAADISIEESKAAKSEAEKAVARAEVADRNLSDYRERSDREIRQARQDIHENTAILDQRHHSLNAREEAVARREADHEQELARLRQHVGRAA